MKLTVRHLGYIVEVAASGSVQGASRKLHISQSSILAAVELAEGEMGARIFDRRPSRGMTLTPAGERLVSAARPVLMAAAEFDRAIGDFGGRLPKTLRIGCFEPFGAIFMAEMLKLYTSQIGDVAITLFEGDHEQIQTWLADGSIDVGVVYDIGRIEAAGSTPICRVPPHAVVSADDPLAVRETLRLSDLAERPFVLLDLPQTATHLLALFDILATRPEVRFRSRSYDTVRSAVACGFGVSVLNMRPIGAGAPDAASLVRRPLEDVLPVPTLVLVDMYGPAKPLFLRVFIDVFQKFFHRIGPEGFAVVPPSRLGDLLVPLAAARREVSARGDAGDRVL